MSTSSVPHPQAIGADDGAIVAEAVLAAAERVGVPNVVLARVIGRDQSSISRLKSGHHRLKRTEKSFELAVLFVRLYRSLDAIVGGDKAAAAAWLRGENRALRGRPIDLIQSVTGLTDVLAYLDSRRAPL
jgi:hypothetical protein